MASMAYNFRETEKLADIASQFNTTVDDIMRLNNVLPPYPTYVKDLPPDVVKDGKIELPYVTDGRQTFESYYNTASEVLGVNYVDVTALNDTLLYNASNRYLASSEFSSTPLMPGRAPIDCYICRVSENDTPKYENYQAEQWFFPCYPESISDSNQASYNSVPILGRSEPFQYYTGSGPRTISVKFQLHTDMCADVNYVYALTDFVEASCYPDYKESGVVVSRILFHVANNITIGGIITSVSTDYSGPIITDKKGSSTINRYAVIDLSFNITEVSLGNPPSYWDIRAKGGRR